MYTELKVYLQNAGLPTFIFSFDYNEDKLYENFFNKKFTNEILKKIK